MNKSRLMSCVLALCLVAISCGCSDQKTSTAKVDGNPIAKAEPVAGPNPTVTETRPNSDAKPTEEQKAQPKQIGLEPTDAHADKRKVPAQTEKPKDREEPATKTPVVTSSKKRPGAQRPFTEAKLLPKDTIGILVGHPMQFLESPFGKLLTDVGVENFSVRGTDIVSRAMQMRFPEIERVTVVLQQSLVDQTAVDAGLQPPPAVVGVPGQADANAGAVQSIQLKNALKQIGLAFHNYHDVTNAFPRADGDAAGETTGLSWRVHLLPYLDQAELYNQFNFEEAWDSENNKALISRMPEIFQTPGVTEEGKTAFQLFAGERTPFEGEQGPSIRNFTDGTSSTILVVLAGADKADVWTKPGGLEVDFSAPRKSLGELKEDKFLALFADGSVRELPADIDEVMLANLIQPNDGNVVDLGIEPMNDSPTPIPLSIFTFAKPPQQDQIISGLLGKPTEEIVEGQKVHSRGSNAVWFSDDRTVVLGTVDSVRKLIGDNREGSDASPLIAQLQLDADFTAAVSLEAQSELLQQLAGPNQMLGMLSNIATISIRISTTGNKGDSLIEVNVAAVDANMAGGLAAIANVALNQAQMSVKQIPENPDASDSDKELQKTVQEMVASAKIQVADEKIQFRVPIPSGFERLPELLKPAMMSARTAAQRTQYMNSLKMMGLAFHNYHDVTGSFPGAGRAAEDKPEGLSWRVHLLPFLDQAPLYNQFHFDEPWDSDHNKTLIEMMPAIFKSPDVDEVGKTSFHVFTGPKALFANDQAPKISQIVDGTSNTILVVLAGADTAEIWTKPGGLAFDPDDPMKSLGKLIGGSFMVLMADGSVHVEQETIDPANLRRMIQMNDGELVQ